MRNAFKDFFLLLLLFWRFFCWSDNNSKKVKKSDAENLQLGLNYLALRMWYLTSYKIFKRPSSSILEHHSEIAH